MPVLPLITLFRTDLCLIMIFSQPSVQFSGDGIEYHPNICQPCWVHTDEICSGSTHKETLSGHQHFKGISLCLSLSLSLSVCVCVRDI